MSWPDITEAELKTILSRSSNWKASGPDGIPNFWWKNLESIHKCLVKTFNDIINEKQNIPKWLTKGKTYLIAKNEKTELPQNFRPICCLNNIYKTLTKIISERLHEHLSENKLFPDEQRGCVKNSYGCKDHLLTSNMILKDCKNNRKTLSLAWIDYKKAYDSIPHSWIIEAMNIYRASPVLISFITRTMAEWKIDLHLTTEKTNLMIRNIQIKTGIYQGDSLSPLLFCMSLFPLSSILETSGTGYICRNEKEKINHLLYVDDLKLIAKNEEELTEQLQKVKEFSDDIHMQFGLDKCAKATFIKGKISVKQNIDLDESTTIKALEQHDVYKYLGIEEHEGIQHKNMKRNLTKEYYRRIKGLLKTELNAKNKIMAITTLAVPVIQYSFGIIKWTKAEIKKLDRQTRKLLTMYGALHPKSDTDRLYLPRKSGGRGMQNIEISHNIAITGLNNYLKLKQTDKYVSMVYRQLNKNNCEDVKKDEINNTNPNETETKRVKSIKQKLKQKKREEQRQKWKDKPMHGQIAREAEKETIDTNATWAWLSKANLKVETEALITACQEQAVTTNYIKAKIMKTHTDQKCRLCRSHDETIHHVISGCPILAKKAYLERHNTVAAHLHWNICREYGIKVNDKWYKHNPDPVINTPDTTIIWDSQVTTDRTIKANKPDIIIKNKKLKTCILIDVSIPSDYNITQKEAEKRLKYKDLQIEIQRLWQMKTTIVPVVIGATGLISHTTCEAIKNLPGNHNLNILQKSVVLGTAHIVRRVL